MKTPTITITGTHGIGFKAYASFADGSGTPMEFDFDTQHEANEFNECVQGNLIKVDGHLMVDRRGGFVRLAATTSRAYSEFQRFNPQTWFKPLPAP